MPLPCNGTHTQVLRAPCGRRLLWCQRGFSLAGLMALHGIKHKLRHVDLHGNCIDSIHHLLQCVVGLHFLTHLVLQKDGEDNPVCRVPGGSGLLSALGNCAKPVLWTACFYLSSALQRFTMYLEKHNCQLIILLIAVKRRTR